MNPLIRWLNARVNTNPFVRWLGGGVLALFFFGMIVAALWLGLWVVAPALAKAIGPWPTLALIVLAFVWIFKRKR